MLPASTGWGQGRCSACDRARDAPQRTRPAWCQRCGGDVLQASAPNRRGSQRLFLQHPQNAHRARRLPAPSRTPGAWERSLHTQGTGSDGRTVYTPGFLPQASLRLHRPPAPHPRPRPRPAPQCPLAIFPKPPGHGRENHLEGKPSLKTLAGHRANAYCPRVSARPHPRPGIGRGAPQSSAGPLLPEPRA